MGLSLTNHTSNGGGSNILLFDLLETFLVGWSENTFNKNVNEITVNTSWYMTDE